MNIYEELLERGLIAQVTDEEEIKKLICRRVKADIKPCATTVD